MGFSHFSYLVDQAKTLGVKTVSPFGFGEPILDSDIIAKIVYCTEQGMKTFITTNASLLNLDIGTGLLKAGLSHIRFSVHGLFENYEKVHRGLKFNEVIRNIFNFIKINKVKFNSACKVDVSVIPMHGETIDEIVAFWGDKVDGIEVWQPHNFGGGREYRKVERRLKTCGRPFSGSPIQIQADGTMIVCCFDSNGELTVGDTYKESIEDILNGDRFNEIRRKHTEGNLTGLICDRCDQLNFGDNPLLYSTIDNERKINCTSSTKSALKAA
jgi:MoaA/NifB/PqqE/SkfB family radical SAM enzyme